MEGRRLSLIAGAATGAVVLAATIYLTRNQAKPETVTRRAQPEAQERADARERAETQLRAEPESPADGAPDFKSELFFALNGQIVHLSSDEIDPETPLIEFIRSRIPGPKLGCGEGGCGACAVILSRFDRATNKVKYLSAPSCLLLLPQVDGWAVTTTEGLGSSTVGYHPIQERIAALSGLQCGFCTPGFVTAIFGALQSDYAVEQKGLTMEEIEGFLDGNLCRCTGYRPILDTAKSFAKDQTIGKEYGPLSSLNTPNFPDALRDFVSKPLSFIKNGKSWYRALDLATVFHVLSQSAGKKVKIVAGNTGRAFERQGFDVYIDVSRVSELKLVEVEQNGLRVGASVSLTELRAILKKHSLQSSSFDPISQFVLRIAGTHVRNVGTVAGNLMLAKTSGFLSDLATALIAAEAEIGIGDSEQMSDISIEEFLANPVLPHGRLVVQVLIPFTKDHYQTFKAAVRHRNAHAYVNAAFKFKVKNGIIEEAICAFGGIRYGEPGEHAVRAAGTEQLLRGKALSRQVLQEALRVLKSEIVPHGHHHEYRHRLVLSFFYKFFLSVLAKEKEAGAKGPGKDAEELDEKILRSATVGFARPVSSGEQTFRFSTEHAPVSEPVPEVSGKLKASGEATFTADVPDRPGTLYAAHVVSDRAHAIVREIDPSPALRLPGVVRFVGASDVPGTNNCNTWPGEVEEVFVQREVLYHRQSLGVILARTHSQAVNAAKAVRVDYERDLPAVVTIAQAKEALAKEKLAKSENSILYAQHKNQMGNAAEADGKNKFRATSTIFQNSQQHFYMEPQTAYAIPEEGGKFTLFSAMQFPGHTAAAVAAVLGIQQSDVQAVMRRCGGGFGGKLHNNIRHAAAAAVAARVTGRPVKLIVQRNIDTAQTGGREETETEYAVSFDEQGKISCVKAESYLMSGFLNALSWFANMTLAHASNECYLFPNYFHQASLLQANLASRTPMRGPGDIEASYVAETIIDHVARSLNKLPEEVRELNFYPFNPENEESLMLPIGIKISHWTIPRLWPLLKSKVRFDEKRAAVDAFNAHNRWRKQGLAITPVRYQVSIHSRQAMVNIYADGSVVLAQDGCEMGQGLHTKVIQAAAYALGRLAGGPLPLNTFRFADTSTYTTPNPIFTGGSTGSEGAAEAVVMCCEQLIERLKPVYQSLAEMKGEAPSWSELCSMADQNGVHLSAVARARGAGQEGLTYQNFGVCCSHVEIDVLTGEVELISSDIVYDCGKSLNPAIDIGQAEGAFVMGLGFYLTEYVNIDPQGRLLTDNTWDYKVPGHRDIPARLTVEFLQDSGFDKGFLSSKCSGEPPLCLATSAVMAVKDAIYSARAEVGLRGFFRLDTPATPAAIATLCAHDAQHLTF